MGWKTSTFFIQRLQTFFILVTFFYVFLTFFIFFWNVFYIYGRYVVVLVARFTLMVQRQLRGPILSLAFVQQDVINLRTICKHRDWQRTVVYTTQENFCSYLWHCSVVVRTLDLQSTGLGFDSRPPHCWVATLDKSFTRTQRLKLRPCGDIEVWVIKLKLVKWKSELRDRWRRVLQQQWPDVARHCC